MFVGSRTGSGSGSGSCDHSGCTHSRENPQRAAWQRTQKRSLERLIASRVAQRGAIGNGYSTRVQRQRIEGRPSHRLGLGLWRRRRQLDQRPGRRHELERAHEGGRSVQVVREALHELLRAGPTGTNNPAALSRMRPTGQRLTVRHLRNGTPGTRKPGTLTPTVGGWQGSR